MKRITTTIALLLMLFGMAGSQPADAMTPDERRAYLAKLQQILPDVPSFNQWLQKTSELPPDFDALPRINGLPEPLRFLDGRAVRTPREWQARRTEIRQLFEKYDLILGPQCASGVRPWKQGNHARAVDDSARQGAVPGIDQPQSGRLGAVAASPGVHLLRIRGE